MYRLSNLEHQAVEAERQRQQVEATSKECLQDLSALKQRLATVELTQNGAARQLKEMQGAQAEIQEQLRKQVQQQEVRLKETQTSQKELAVKMVELHEIMVKTAQESSKLKDVSFVQLKCFVVGIFSHFCGEDQMAPLDTQLKAMGFELRRLSDELHLETEDREKAVGELKRKLTQEETERASDTNATDQKISTLTTRTEESLKTLKADLEEQTRHVAQCQKEGKLAADGIDHLKEKLKEETTSTREHFQAQKKNTDEQIEEMRKQMQQQFNQKLAECQKEEKAAADRIEQLKEEATSTKERIEAQKKNTAEQIEEMRRQMQQQFNQKLAECQKEEKAAADRIEQLNENLKEESTSRKERIEAQKKNTAEQIEEMKKQMQQHFNSQLQQMQKDLKSFLHEQDTALQESVQKQMAELHDTVMQRTQTLLGNRIEKCQADVLRIEKKGEQTDDQLRSLKELQASTQAANERKLLDLQKEVVTAVQKNAAGIQKLKAEQDASQSVSAEGHLNSFKSTEDKLCADLKAVKEGIDSIKNSVNGHATATLPWNPIQGPCSGMMTPPSPTPFWPTKSQPCSPISRVRTTGPLLRPSMSASRPSSLSPPWVRPMPVVSMAKAPPPIGWLSTSCPGCPEPVAHTQASSHVPAAFLPQATAAVVVASQQSQQSQQSGSSSESSAEVQPPGVLKISCPATPGLPTISGEYALVSGVYPNGRPLWKHKQQELWLYFGTNNRWFVGGPDSKEWKFKCEAGFIYSEPVTAGSTPDQAAGWARFQGGLFVADSSVTVQENRPCTSHRNCSLWKRVLLRWRSTDWNSWAISTSPRCSGFGAWGDFQNL
eukprot:symbB.v1.2.030221.t1/scaffold3380.1/size79486/7